MTIDLAKTCVNSRELRKIAEDGEKCRQVVERTEKNR